MLSSLQCRRELAFVFATASLVVGCGGGGGDPAPAPAPVPNAAINQTTSYQLENTVPPVDLGTLIASDSLAGANFDARVLVDLDGDGVKEIVIALVRANSGQSNALRIFRRQVDGSYANRSTDFLAAPVIVPAAAKVVAADFNGDGRADLYIANGTTSRAPDVAGSPDVLLLSNASTGKLEVKPVAADEIHSKPCAAAGDVDNNGTIDIFVCSAEVDPQTPMGYPVLPADVSKYGPYLLLNDGKGNFTVSRGGIPPSLKLTDFQSLPSPAELVDVDGDGFLDVLLAAPALGSVANKRANVTRIYWGAGTGTFADDRMSTVNVNAPFDPSVDVKAEDIDGDGRRDIVVLTQATVDLNGYAYRIGWVRQTAARQLSLSTPSYVTDPVRWNDTSALQASPKPRYLYLTDLNGDGSLDISLLDSAAVVPSRSLRWLNDGRAGFSLTP